MHPKFLLLLFFICYESLNVTIKNLIRIDINYFALHVFMVFENLNKLVSTATS